jgi:o-succinylbenzoate synthase
MRVEPFSLPLSRPLGTARGTITEREGALIRVSHEGANGLGEASPLPGWTESLSNCRAALAAVEDPVSALGDGSLDKTPAARHGVELAVEDARAHARGVPLAVYLADEAPTASVPVNATVGDGGIEETVASARAAVDAGFEAVKVKVGVRSLGTDIDRLVAVRDVCPAVELRADANGAWDRETAREAFDALAPLELAYVEQPLAESDLEGHAALRGGPVGVALDETLASRSPERVLEAGAADVLVLKPMALGGPRSTLSLARRAQEVGVTPVVTTTIDGAVARTGAVHVAAALPEVPACGLATGDWLEQDLLDTDPVPVVDGAIEVPGGPGLGC